MKTARDEANAAFVERFQRAAGLTVDGWAGARTIAKLEKLLPIPAPPPVRGLESFRGDLTRVHGWEGHNGRPYWPGGSSGVTLDPGFDLGQNREPDLRRHYLDTGILDEAGIGECRKVIGLKGKAAREALAKLPALRALRVSRALAARVFPHLAADYWQAIVRRFPELSARTTPPGVQTALLSLSYNRGAGNQDLQPLAIPISRGYWDIVADTIAEMQQDHKLPGIRQRRREEAEMIRADLKG